MIINHLTLYKEIIGQQKNYSGVVGNSWWGEGGVRKILK